MQSARIGFKCLLECRVFWRDADAAALFLVFFIVMFVGYRIMGLAANIALMLYILIMLNVMALMGSVLTLPGIAGIILGIGMAVDANVVIFSRIREE